jgi:hypothetical protein
VLALALRAAAAARRGQGTEGEWAQALVGLSRPGVLRLRDCYAAARALWCWACVFCNTFACAQFA